MRSLTIFVLHPSDMLTDHLPNGAGWIVYNYLKGLVERGHIVHVAVPRIEMRGPVPRGMHLHHVPKRVGMIGRLSYALAVRRLLARLRRFIHFDIVQQFTPVETALSLGVLGTSVPLVLGPYSGHWDAAAFRATPQKTLVTRLKQIARDAVAWAQQRQAAALIITCPAAIDRIVSRRKRLTAVHVVSHGIDSSGYAERAEVPVRPSILFLANLEYWKGIFTLLEAFEQVAAAIQDCTLEIWGDGVETTEVVALISRSEFKDRIFLRGRASRDKVADIMRSHSVYCLPSYGEPFGMTILEAMASGVPVVTTDVGGPAFLIHEGGGRVVPMRNSTRLAEALREILSDRQLQQSMGSYNRRRVEQDFDWRRSIDRMESVYEWVLTVERNLTLYNSAGAGVSGESHDDMRHESTAGS